MSVGARLRLKWRKVQPEALPTWQFPRSGTSQHVHVPESELADIQHQIDQPRKLLSEWPATAISGNDILGSVLYAAASVVSKAGKLMPVALLMVAIVLYFFRFIYEEVVTAIPMNGGTYNALLNTTSKRAAAVTACLSILSYVATGVVSATSGVHYLDTQVDIPIVACTIALLFVFALLALVGIAENSRVALVIFLHHIVVLSILVVSCVVHGIKNPHIFRDNMEADFPEVDFAGTMLDGNACSSVSVLQCWVSLFFESSSSYVEEQAPGVFRKTLRNMWALASFFNVCLGVGILAVLPLGGDNGIYASSDALLSKAAEESLGSWFSTWVSVDAFIVLSGSVLTSYVGICGLVRRLATDRVLPSFLATTNKLRGTNHNIIGAFFLLSASLVLLLDADSGIMNGVYTYAFLGLMALFASAAMLLKAKRPEIPRDVIAPWSVLVLGLIMVVVAIFANLLGDPSVLMYFALYFISVALVMFIIYFRTRDTPEVEHTGARGGRTIARAITSIRSAPIVFFCKRPDLTIINKVIVYVRRNEQTHTLRIVHVFSGEESDVHVLEAFRNLAVLFDSMYPKIRIDFMSVQGEFNPATIEWLSKKMDVPRNMMFITQPDMVSAECVSSVGVRVITA
ncbi:Amino acid permease [Phytophthora infestans]|uniref:Amino acid permease n=1 Tax=Phytophthora infestans TaxID=4787 RepID=A0A833WMU2_PHYIN|nr:Amino acid permease [Phytophthora infestans]